MEIEFKIAILGIIGTISGTVVGWILGKLNFGKIRIDFDKIQTEFITPGQSSYIPGIQSNEIYLYKYQLSIQIYNSYESNKVIRNLKLQFTDGKSNEFYEPLMDDKTGRKYGGGTKYDSLDIINIQGKAALLIQAHIYTEEIDKLLKCKKLYLYYKNERLKTHKKFIQNIDYSMRSKFLQEDKPND